MSLPKISVGTIFNAHKTFMREEVRGFVYRLAMEERQRSPENAILLLLIVWNVKAYKDHIATGWLTFLQKHKKALEDGIMAINNDPRLSALRDANLRAINIPQNRHSIKECFEHFMRIDRVGPTGVSKALHVLMPNLFVMWDDRIRSAYRCAGNGSEDGYLKFLQLMQGAASSLEESVWGNVCRQCDDFSIPKLLDEYNYVSYTLGISVPASDLSMRDKAMKMLRIIQEIYEGGREILGSGWKIYSRMQELAEEGNVAGMVQYYT